MSTQDNQALDDHKVALIHHGELVELPLEHLSKQLSRLSFLKNAGSMYTWMLTSWLASVFLCCFLNGALISLWNFLTIFIYGPLWGVGAGIAAASLGATVSYLCARVYNPAWPELERSVDNKGLIVHSEWYHQLVKHGGNLKLRERLVWLSFSISLVGVCELLFLTSYSFWQYRRLPELDWQSCLVMFALTVLPLCSHVFLFRSMRKTLSSEELLKLTVDRGANVTAR